MSSAGGAKFEPPSRPLEAGKWLYLSQNRQGCEILLFGCERLGFCLGWDSKGGRRGPRFRQLRVPVVGAMSTAGGAKFEPPSRPLEAS